MKTFRTLLFALAALVFVGAAGIQIYIALQPEPERIVTANLGELLPMEVEGWEVIDKELANTPEMEARAADILQYTDVLARDYTKPGTLVSVYIGYWGPGKMPYNLIGSHTPDTCWVTNGFDRTARSHRVVQTVDGIPLRPYEWGTYEKDGQEIEVIFWHVVGNDVYNYDPDYVGWDHSLWGKVERGLEFMTDFERYGLSPQRDQVFVRISSNRPFSELWQDEDFQRLIATFAPMNIFEGDGTTAVSEEPTIQAPSEA